MSLKVILPLHIGYTRQTKWPGEDPLDKMSQKRRSQWDMNVLCILRQKEYGVKSNARMNIKTVKRVVCKKGSTFKRVWHQSSRQAIAYEDGRLYFNNYRKCYATYGQGGVPHLLYSLPSCPASEKIEDGLVCQCPLADLPLEHQGYRPHFLALHSNNWLVRYDLLTGQVLQKVFLTETCRFRSISWDLDQTRIVFKSKHYEKHWGRGVTEDRLVTLGLFSVFPLEFIALLDVTRSVFGLDIVDALITMGLLIIMNSGDRVQFFSMTSILEQGLQFSARLHHHCDRAGGVVGTHPTGVPFNIKLTERPAVLFEVKCEHHNVNVGGIPWHYIISPVYSSCYMFRVHSLSDHRQATRGTLCMGTLGLEPDKCFFHADNSGRILHIGQNELSVFQITECGSGSGHQVKVVFTVDAANLREADKKTPQKAAVRRTSSGRVVRPAPTYGDPINEQREIVDVDYEDELDLLAVTCLDADGTGKQATVHLIDNQTGHRRARVTLDEPWKDYLDHDVAVDMDTLVHIVRGGGQFHCYLYRLDRRPQDTEVKAGHTQAHNNARPHRAGPSQRRGII